MRLVTFAVDQPTGTTTRVGVVDGSEYVDVTAGYATLLAEDGHPRPLQAAESLVPPDMVSFLEGGDEAMDAAESARSLDVEVGYEGARVRYDADEVLLKSPLPRPRTLRDFSVFEDHGGEKGEDWYEVPAYYNGNPDAVVDPETTVQWPEYSDVLDYELEVGAVIGREARDVDADEALDYVAGFTIFNDFSARDIQRRQGLSPGKGKDFANGFGPYLVTTDEFTPEDAEMVARVDGEEWSRGNMGEMYHTWPDVVEFASWGETLYPGAVLGSGTVGGGCGADLGRYPDRGAVVELKVEGLGVLRHQLDTAE